MQQKPGRLGFGGPRIGFRGSEKRLTKEQLASLRRLLPEIAPDRISAHHGMCVGADIEFHDLVRELYKKREHQIVGHPASHHRLFHRVICDIVWPARHYLTRNRDIVDVTDVLIACPKESEEPPKKPANANTNTNTEEVNSEEEEKKEKKEEKEEFPRGIWYTIRYANDELFKRVIVIRPDGTVA